MKTVEQAAKQYAIERHGADPEYHPDRYESSEAFLAGVEFANQWIDIATERPPYYQNVNVTYKYKPSMDNQTTCWLAVGDDGEYLWMVSGTDVVLPDGVVKKWKPIEF